MALLHLLASLREKEHLSLFATHVNYGLRGEESDADERLVREACDRYGIECFVRHVSGALRDEAALREIRFGFFREILEKTHSDRIALAHHRDDQAETVLFRFLRGSGARGLGAMRPRSGEIVRPFLAVSRAEIRAYAAAEDVSFRDDASNFSDAYARNRLRHEILPIIRDRINPNIDETLAGAASVFADEEAFLENMLSKRFVLKRTKEGVSFSLSVWRELGVALERRAIRRAIAAVEENAPLNGISCALVEEIRQALLSEKPKRQRVECRGLIVERKGDRVCVERADRQTMRSLDLEK